MATILRLTIPFPTVTGNHSTRHGRFGSYTSTKAKVYRWSVAQAVNSQGGKYRLDAPFNLTIRAWPPDRRRRDKDNMEKVALDALTLAGVWVDDSLIADKHHLAWGEADKKGARVELEIEPLEPPTAA